MQKKIHKFFKEHPLHSPLVVISFFLLVMGLFFTLSLVQQSQDIRQRAATVAATVEIDIQDFQFSQPTITIPAGTVVRWTNRSVSNSFHTSSSDAQGTPESWDSQLLSKGNAFSKTFSTPGVYKYHCNVHTTMTGTIIVTAAPTSTITQSSTPTPGAGIPSAVCLGACPTAYVTKTPTVPYTTPTKVPPPPTKVQPTPTTYYPPTPPPTKVPTPTVAKTPTYAPSTVPCPTGYASVASQGSAHSTMNMTSKKSDKGNGGFFGNIFQFLLELIMKLLYLLFGVGTPPITPAPVPTIMPTAPYDPSVTSYPTPTYALGATVVPYPSVANYPTPTYAPGATVVPYPSSTTYPTPTSVPYATPTPPCAPTPAMRSVDSFQYVPRNEPLKTFDLVAEVVGDKWLFNRILPGPEWRVNQGDHIRVNLLNMLPEGLAIHWHGIVLPNSQDGVPGVTQNAVKPGASFTYDFVVPDAGTYWYHTHQNTSQQLPKGLFGSLIVAPKQESIKYDRDYSIVYRNPNPTTTTLDALPGEKVRLRLLNARVGISSGAPLKLAPIGVPFKVIALDGQDINQPQDITGQNLPIGVAQRFDIAFTMPASGSVQLADLENLQTINVGEGALPTIPNLNTQPDFDFMNYGLPTADTRLIRPTFDKEETLTIGANFTINGKQSHEIPDLVVKEGQQVLIHYVNNSDMYHPMHLHGHFYSVLKKNGKPVTGSPIHLDSILLGPGETADVAFVANAPGVWMLHCHVLAHAAAGLTMMVRYDDVYTPYKMGGDSGNIAE